MATVGTQEGFVDLAGALVELYSRRRGEEVHVLIGRRWTGSINSERKRLIGT